MLGTLQRVDSSTPQSMSAQDTYARPQSMEGQPLRAAATRAPASLVERMRTFVDRTLDAAFGRFDH